jgi:hypothetical protein
MAEVTPAFEKSQREYAEHLGLPQCFGCKHSHHNGMCDAFPKGIPRAILGDYHDHRKPYPGDNGIRFEAKEIGRGQ